MSRWKSFIGMKSTNRGQWVERGRSVHAGQCVAVGVRAGRARAEQTERLGKRVKSILHAVSELAWWLVFIDAVSLCCFVLGCALRVCSLSLRSSAIWYEVRISRIAKSMSIRCLGSAFTLGRSFSSRKPTRCQSRFAVDIKDGASKAKLGSGGGDHTRAAAVASKLRRRPLDGAAGRVGGRMCGSWTLPCIVFVCVRRRPHREGSAGETLGEI